VLQLRATLRGEELTSSATSDAATRPALPEPESAAQQRWSSVVRQRALRMMPKRTTRGSERLSAVTPAEAVTMEGLLARWRSIFDMHRAVSALPREYREVLVLSDLEGLDLAQVGWLLELDDEEITARLLQARTLVRQQLSAAPLTDDA
jgi:DNA-directed RNA polymerase specialized sigma24 family protein